MKIYNYDGKSNIVGKNIYKYRKQLDLSQEQLAARMQVNNVEITQKVISRIENQERFVTDYELLIFSQVLKVSVYDLLDQSSQ